MSYCSNCGSEANLNDNYCQTCGFNLQTESSQNLDSKVNLVNLASQTVSEKSVGIAAVLAVVPGFFGLWGLGHFYAGKILRGVVFLIVGLILLVGLVSIVTFISGLLGPTLITLIQEITAFNLEFLLEFLAKSLGIVVVVLIVGAIIIGLGYLFQAIDACRAVQKWNKILNETHRKPW